MGDVTLLGELATGERENSPPLLMEAGGCCLQKGEPMSTSPTCPTCSEPVSDMSEPSGTVRLEPCGHSVPEDVTKHWRKKEGEAVGDTYVPEDVAARESVDRGEVTPSRDDQLHDLLEYFRSKADEDGAYRDAGDRLSAILVESWSSPG